MMVIPYFFVNVIRFLAAVVLKCKQLGDIRKCRPLGNVIFWSENPKILYTAGFLGIPKDI
jgi:hypothetical protein